MIKQIVEWIGGARWRKSLSHIFTTIPAMLLGGPIGVFLWSFCREQVQHQYALKGAASTLTVWSKGWNPLEWVKTGGWWTWADVAFPTVFWYTIGFVI